MSTSEGTWWRWAFRERVCVLLLLLLVVVVISGTADRQTTARWRANSLVVAPARSTITVNRLTTWARLFPNVGFLTCLPALSSLDDDDICDDICNLQGPQQEKKLIHRTKCRTGVDMSHFFLLNFFSPAALSIGRNPTRIPHEFLLDPFHRPRLPD